MHAATTAHANTGRSTGSNAVAGAVITRKLPVTMSMGQWGVVEAAVRAPAAGRLQLTRPGKEVTKNVYCRLKRPISQCTTHANFQP